MSDQTATEIAMQSGPTPHDLMVARVARLIAKREHGPQHIGYETGHREAAVEYVNEVMSVWFSLNPPDIRGLDQLLPS